MSQGKGVYKRGNVWWLAFVDVHGRVIRETSGTSDYKSALKKLADCRDKVAKGKEVEKRKIRKVLFADAVAEYLKWAKPQLAYMNKFYMKEDLIARFGNIPLKRFNVAMLETFQQGLLVEGKAAATINRRMAMLKHLFHKASDWNMVDDDTLRIVRKVKALKEPPGRLRYLTPEEARRLLAECKKRLLREIVTVALNTGMRRGEILALKWENVDLRNGYVQVVQSKNGESRTVPINSSVREVLSGIVRRLDVSYVFCDPKGRAMKEVGCSFDSACKRAGLYNFHFHDLRHSAASFMAMGGIDLLSIGKILGHKTFSMTQRYAHLSPGHLRNAVAAIDAAMASNQTPTSQFTSQSAFLLPQAAEGTAVST